MTDLAGVIKESGMTLTDLFSELDSLDRDDKLRIIDHLMDELETKRDRSASADEAAHNDAR